MYAIRYIVVTLTLTWYSTADNMGEFCLEKGVAFINEEYKCSFTKETAQEFFNKDNNMYHCQRNCSVDLNWFFLDDHDTYRVKELQLTIGDFTLKHNVCQFENSYGIWSLILNINCLSRTQDVYTVWTEGNCDFNCTRILNTCICSCPPGYIMLNGHCLLNNVVVGGACMYEEQCKGTEHSGVCLNRTCVCETGYISIHHKCHKGNVSLDNKCLFHAQCSGSPNASCRDGYCTCIEGYIPDESSKCFLSRPINDQEAFIGDQRESSLGSTLGALFGGVVLGVLITTVIGFIIHKRIHQNYKRRQTQEPRVVFADNNGYGDAEIERIVDNASRSNKPNQRKIVNVPPYAPSSQSPEYGNISQTSRTKGANEDIYNHLNEKENPDDDDNYDHACAATGHMRGNFDSDYSSMRDVDKGYSSSVAKGTDDYFTLEQN
uniref:Uncharacterized protein LOC111106778 isoform X1 n=1 Tax=Crassostrea virginica TaxID=6565 RepID=A0A8B8B1L9_CRAVI|nr:uncharacterized protein LOC111106778 isoform X1 [Crassostrea virginica]XP_022297306.1 uncharacterized protein LOC111106778 isoform X1 [Crassostrea virginica]XP_022297307.1 uncharacterized protein LOC111106778 isoform X1 [Crassostrea virginica]